MHNELFNPIDIFTYYPRAVARNEQGDRWATLGRDLYPEAFLDHIWTGKFADDGSLINEKFKAVGFKSFPDHWKDVRNEHIWQKAIMNDFRIKKVVLYREDELAVFVSMMRAEKTGRYMTLKYPEQLKIKVDPVRFQAFTEILVTRDPKHVTILELLSQRNDIVVKEAQLTLVPKRGWIHAHSARTKGKVHFLEQKLVPLAVNVPMLHGMRHVRRLDDVINDNRCLEVDAVFVGDFVGTGEGLVPTGLAQIVQLLVENVGREDDIDNYLAETKQLLLGVKDAAPKLVKLFGHKQVPRDIKRILLGNTLVPVGVGQMLLLLAQLCIGHTTVVSIVDQRGEDNTKHCERVRVDTVRIVMETRRQLPGALRHAPSHRV
jgi:hypothetical protein